MTSGQLRPEFPASGPDFSYRVSEAGGTVRVTLGDTEVTLDLTVWAGEGGSAEGWVRAADGGLRSFLCARVGSQVHLWLAGYQFVFQRPESPTRRGRASGDRPGEVLAPMPGTVLQVLVQAGDRVEPGQPVVVLESMKMELTIDAPRAAVVRRLAVSPGSRVDRGMRLLELDEETPESAGPSPAPGPFDTGPGCS